MPEQIAKVPISIVRRISKEYFPEMRISKKALMQMQNVASDFIRSTLEDSKKLAEHRGRKTIEEKDVAMAMSIS